MADGAGSPPRKPLPQAPAVSRAEMRRMREGLAAAFAAATTPAETDESKETREEKRKSAAEPTAAASTNADTGSPPPTSPRTKPDKPLPRSPRAAAAADTAAAAAAKPADDDAPRHPAPPAKSLPPVPPATSSAGAAPAEGSTAAASESNAPAPPTATATTTTSNPKPTVAIMHRAPASFESSPDSPETSAPNSPPTEPTRLVPLPRNAPPPPPPTQLNGNGSHPPPLPRGRPPPAPIKASMAPTGAIVGPQLVADTLRTTPVGAAAHAADGAPHTFLKEKLRLSMSARERHAPTNNNLLSTPQQNGSGSSSPPPPPARPPADARMLAQTSSLYELGGRSNRPSNGVSQNASGGGGGSGVWDWDAAAAHDAMLPSNDHSELAVEDKDFEVSHADVHCFHDRLLEGYRVWCQETGQSAGGGGKGAGAARGSLTPVEKMREILLWRVIVSLSEHTGFCAEHLAMNFHAIVGSSARLDGSKERPYHIDLHLLQKGIAELSRGDINLDDINSGARSLTGVYLRPSNGIERTVHAKLFDQHSCYFSWEGEDGLAFMLQSHVDAQARNVEKLLGKYVPTQYIDTGSAADRSAFFERTGKKPSAAATIAASVAAASKSTSKNYSEPYQKYFHEPEKWGVAVLILRNYWSLMVFKVWALLFALQVNLMWPGSTWFQRFATADAIMVLMQCIIEISARGMVYRWRLLRGLPFSGFMNVTVLLVQAIFVALALVILSGLFASFFSMAIPMPAVLVSAVPIFFDAGGVLVLNLFSLYLIARLVAFLVYNIYLWLGFTPLVKGNEDAMGSSLRKRFRWRVLGTVVFWAAVLGTVSAFECLVLVPAVANLTPTVMCECSDLVSCTYQASLQCWIFLVVMWSLIWANFLIDTHVAFVLLLSIIGLCIGLTSRLRPTNLEQLRMRPAEVVTAIGAKWLGPSADRAKAVHVWNCIVDEMWEADVLSEAHQKQLKLSEPIPDEEWLIELPVAEAQERMAFFINSLRMHTPAPPPSLAAVPAVTTLIPSLDEQLVFSYEDLRRPHYYGGKPGPTDLGYLISCNPQEWEYLCSRLKLRGLVPWNWTALQLYQEFIDKRIPVEGPVVERIRLWASYRAQTVARTIRGVTYYRRVLRELGADEKSIRRRYQVILCLQTYAAYDANRVNAVHLLAREFPNIEIVYDFDREAHCKPHPKPHVERLAELVASHGIDFATVREEWNAREQRLELTAVLPRLWPLLVGPEGRKVQGKALNQRCGLLFAWGEFIQTLDANQDFTFEDALKVPVLLECFYPKAHHRRLPHGGADGSKPGGGRLHATPRYRIIGFRETIYTGQLSAVGKYLALADFSFTTIFGRILANPLSVRMHYGHPDFFDGMWVLSRGALNKASPIINLNEDIYAGYMATLRSQRITHKEFLQARKGRETSLRLADLFEAKLAEGAAAQLRSSDLFELNDRLNFLKKMSLFHGSIGFYIVMTVMAYSITLYVLMMLLFSLAGISLQQLGQLGSIYSTELVVALGFVYMLPGVVELLLAYGLKKFVSVALNFVPSSLFFGFLLQTKASYFKRSMVSGGASYRATGRKLSIERQSLKSDFLAYADSHLIPGIRLLLLIFLYHIVSLSVQQDVGVLPLFTPTIVAFTWLLVPQLFNPFTSFEATTADAKEIWSWLTRAKDLDLVSLSYAYPKGDKRLGVPQRRDVEDDCWMNWYLLRQAQRLREGFASVSDTILSVLVHALFMVVVVLFVLSANPSALLCFLYLCLVLCFVLFLIGIESLCTLHSKPSSFFTIVHILLDLGALLFFIFFLAFSPVGISASFTLVDYIVAAIVLLMGLRFVRNSVYLAVGPSLRHSPKALVSMIYYVDAITLQSRLHWACSFVVVCVQVTFSYVLSLFPRLHTTLLYNPNLTTRTHGLDSLSKGSLRKIEHVPSDAASSSASSSTSTNSDASASSTGKAPLAGAASPGSLHSKAV